MKIAKSIRLEKDIVDIIEKHKGNSFTAKLEKIVLYADCFDHKVERARILLDIKESSKLCSISCNHLSKLRKGFKDLIIKHSV